VQKVSNTVYGEAVSHLWLCIHSLPKFHLFLAVYKHKHTVE